MHLLPSYGSPTSASYTGRRVEVGILCTYLFSRKKSLRFQPKVCMLSPLSLDWRVYIVQFVVALLLMLIASKP